MEYQLKLPTAGGECVTLKARLPLPGQKSVVTVLYFDDNGSKKAVTIPSCPFGYSDILQGEATAKSRGKKTKTKRTRIEPEVLYLLSRDLEEAEMFVVTPDLLERLREDDEDQSEVKDIDHRFWVLQAFVLIDDEGLHKKHYKPNPSFTFLNAATDQVLGPLALMVQIFHPSSGFSFLLDITYCSLCDIPPTRLHA
jgi:hypothetical protein